MHTLDAAKAADLLNRGYELESVACFVNGTGNSYILVKK